MILQTAWYCEPRKYHTHVAGQTLWQCRCIVPKTSMCSIHIMTHQSYIISSHNTVNPHKGIHVIIEDIALWTISPSSILYALHNMTYASHHLCIVIQYAQCSESWECARRDVCYWVVVEFTAYWVSMIS